jgi:hypothetical protein
MKCPNCGFMGIGGVNPPIPSPKNENTKVWLCPYVDPEIIYSDYDSDHSGLSQFPSMFTKSLN